MNADIVCEGGGVKGIALLGAICCLEENGYIFKNFAGTSAGAIVAALMSVGYTGSQLKELLLDLDFKKFCDKRMLSCIPIIGPPISLIKNKGFYCGDYAEKFLFNLFRAKGKTKFKDISLNGTSPLKIIASDVTKKELLILPDDLSKYNIDPLEFEISKAVRMSISIPFFFDPVILKNDSNHSFIVDGGLLSNFPIWLFDSPNKPQWPTFGLKLISDKDLEKTTSKKNNLITYSMDIIDTLLTKDDAAFLANKDAVRTIKINTFNINTVDFGISKENSLKLFNSGYDCTKEFLLNWNFTSYLSRYRSN